MFGRWRRRPFPWPIEFLAGVAIQVLLLGAMAALMARLAETLRRGRAALAADLDRERELHVLKDRFIATVSHELRTPLTALKGFARALMDEPGSDAGADYVSIIVEQSEELHTLIEDLVTFNRLEAGQLTIRPEPVDLAEKIRSVIDGMGLRAGTVGVEVPADTFVYADPIRVAQVVRNLVDNALRYGRSPVVLTARAEGTRVVCRVSDSGDGLSVEAVESAFEPYTRYVDNSTMSEPGIGLGLSIVRELVEAQGGVVRYLPGESAFEFTLPPVRAAVPAGV